MDLASTSESSAARFLPLSDGHASTGNAMPPATEFAADERCVLEPHARRDAVRNRDLSAAFAIQLHLDETVRSRDAALEMPERAKPRRDFRARVAGSGRSHAQNPGGQIVGWRRRPCVTPAPSAGARVPVLLECGVATLDLRPP